MQAEEYGFSVEFEGVGEDPGGHRDLGHCSQLAVFHRLKEADEDPPGSQENQAYELVSECDHLDINPLLHSVTLKSQTNYCLLYN